MVIDMVTDQSVRRIALFFLFSFMDEKVALQAAHKAVAHVKMATPKGSEAIDESQLVRILNKIYLQFKRQVPRNRAVANPLSWQLPVDGDLSIEGWRKFQRDATEAELVAVVLAKILGFSEEALVTGLGLSLGTVHYRIGKGIRLLGRALSSVESRSDARS